MKEYSVEEKNLSLENIYKEKRKKSVEIVKLSIEALQQNDIKITLQSIVNIALDFSKKFNDSNFKISHMTILRNEECRELYENARESKHKKTQNNFKKISPPLTKYEINKIRAFSKLTKKDLLVLLIESERENKNERLINTNLREKLIELQIKI